MPHVHIKPDTSLYDTIMRSRIDLPNGQSIFSCPTHGPATGMTSAPPTNSCPGCWILFYLRLEAVTPPDKREELMYNLNKYVSEAVKLAEAGKFDLELPLHPKIDIDLDDKDISIQ